MTTPADLNATIRDAIWDNQRIRDHYDGDCDDPLDITTVGDRRRQYVCGAGCTDPVSDHTPFGAALAWLNELIPPVDV